MRTEEELTRTAYHEAGHTLIAYLEGQANRITNVTIKPDGNVAGSTNFIPARIAEMGADGPAKILRIYYAGLQAEYLCCARHNAHSEEKWNENTWFAHAAYDIEWMDNFLNSLPLSEERRNGIYEAQGMLIAGCIREPQNTHALVKLAEALLARETLTGDEARAIIAEAINSAPGNQEQ